MFLEAVIIGIIVGWIRGGRIANFFSYDFKGRYLAILALFIFVFSFVLYALGVHINHALLPFIALVIAAIIALLNYRTFGMKLFFVGLLSNIFVMAVHSMRMPINGEKMAALGKTWFTEALAAGEILNYQELVGSKGLSLFLGKNIALPAWYPLATVVSPGDIIICIAMILIIQDTMIYRRKGGMFSLMVSPRGK